VVDDGYDNDVLTGGSEADTFLFRDSEFGHDRITDFRFAEGDRINFAEHQYSSPVTVLRGAWNRTTDGE
jgi:Ca2+-binding RTX toxin-like protein